MTVRGAMFGVAIMGLAGVLAGCVTDGNKGETGTMAKPSAAEFEVKFDSSDPVETLIVVEPDEGDVWLEAVKVPKEGENRVIWKSKRSFAIKFVQIDDNDKSPSKKFGDEADGWNDASPVAGEYIYPLKLKNGEGKKKKSIQGAKYIVKSPAGCDEKSPGPNCLVLDPIIIVRY